MLVLGIDPGTINMGYGVINVRGSNVSYIISGVLRLKSKDFYENYKTFNSQTFTFYADLKNLS